MPSKDPALSQGGDHVGMEAVWQGMGRARRVAILDRRRGGVSQCHDSPDERGGAVAAVDRPRFGVQHRDRGQYPQTLPAARSGRARPSQAAGTHLASHARIPRCLADGHSNAAPATGLRFQRLVAGPPQRPLAKADRHRLQRGPVGTDHASGRIFVPASQAHDEGEAGRGGLRAGGCPPANAGKKPSATMRTSC